MPINVQCSCSATYLVKDELAGKLMRCKSCDAKLRITAADLPKPPQIERPEVLPEPDLYTPEKQEQIDQKLDRQRKLSQSAASNPGRFQVSILQYSKAHPRYPLMYFGGLAVGLLLSLVSFWFLIIAAFFAHKSRLFISALKINCIAGCVNPGMIVSLDPPLVAIYTDLTKGGDQFPVVKIEAHPIHQMTTGAPEVGQKVPTYANYVRSSSEQRHWANFTPQLTACATRDTRVVQKHLKSIEREDWKSLKAGLAQIPKPFTAGLYRYYPSEALDRRFELEDRDIGQLIEHIMHGVHNCLMVPYGDRISSEAKSYIPRHEQGEVIAVIQSAQEPGGENQGIALLESGAYYHFAEIGKGQFAWDELVGAFLARGILELTFTDSQRLEVSVSHFSINTIVRLEILMDLIGRGSSNI